MTLDCQRDCLRIENERGIRIHIGRSLLRIGIIAILITPLASCGYLDQVTAMRTFKEGNMAYGRGDYQLALEHYEEILEIIESQSDSLLNEQLNAAYFYVANSYDNLYKPVRKGEPENDAYLEEAVHYYETAADRINDPDLQRLSMQYLVSAFGPDKANDPTRSEPVLRQMILLEPENPDNYFALANLYEQSGLFEPAEAVMLEIQSLRPDDPIVYLQLAGFYNRSGEFELTIDALEQRARIEPDNPEAFYTISTFYWEKAFRDFRITQDEKADYITAGLEAADIALGLNERYVDALVYKNILLRMKAGKLVCENTADTACIEEQDGLIAEADELRDRAQDLQEQATSGAGGPAA